MSQRHTLARLRRRLRSDERGTAAVMMALAALPVVMALGVAVDHGNQVRIQTRLQNAADAAALAAGRRMGASKSELQATAARYFYANYGTPLGSSVPSVALSTTETGVVVDAQVAVQNYIMRAMGYETAQLHATSQVTKEATGIEVVLVFDNTASMSSGSKLATLKVAARDFVNILFGDRETASTVKVAVVPFSQFVRVDPALASQSWLDKTGANPQSSANFENAGWHNWSAWEALANRSWPGCVEARDGNLAVDDVIPTAANPATLFVPAFAPDEPGDSASTTYFRANGTAGTSSNYAHAFTNSYLQDSSTSSLDSRQRHQSKYSGKSVTVTARGPDKGCNMLPIQPLSNTKQDVLDTLEAMVATGYTHIAEGVGWGLRVLSPQAPFTEGASYGDKKTKKVMILLSDGENTFETKTNMNASTYTAYGYLTQARLGSADYWTALNTQNTLTARACDNVKDKDIALYTFAYGVPNGSAKDMIKACATTPEMFFDPPTNAALVRNFQEIADALRNLYLSQ